MRAGVFVRLSIDNSVSAAVKNLSPFPWTKPPHPHLHVLFQPSLLNFPLKEHRVFKSKSISPQQKCVVNSRAQMDNTKILWCAGLNWCGINWSLTRLSRNLSPIFTRFVHHLIEKIHSLFHSWYLQGIGQWRNGRSKYQSRSVQSCAVQERPTVSRSCPSYPTLKVSYYANFTFCF